ncbi:MAG TPA: polyprenyl diphosphate synthase [Candidatus Saccharimonadales bacterium]|jgi:undecaprenyl diphosphate synthase|nr:polyprenyl diphosphate synthase [Candidatus Saccharimonadales bacterium]
MSTATFGLAPKHLGLILDGNRRWAREHGYPIIEGHRRGYYSLKRVVKSAIKEGVQYVSAYVFSSENWNRSSDEVSKLMKLTLWVLKHEVQEFHRENIRLRVVGSKLKLGTALVKAIHEAEELTRGNDRGTLLLCLDYGGQQEIVEATKRIAAAGYKPEEITSELISQFLYAPDVPPIDLIIRTSGEQRLSNFMLWESAYSELLFSKVYWPDFSELDLHEAIEQYAVRHRRFGS